MKIKTHKNQIKKMIEEILLEETGNVPSRAIVRICELFEDFETADIEMITLSRRAYQRKLGRINSPFAKERWGRVVTPYLYRCGVQIPTCYLSRGIQESKVSLKFRLGGTTSESCTRGVA